MASKEEAIIFEYEDETNYYTWQRAHMELEADTGEITIRVVQGGNFAVSIPASEIDSYEIVLRKDVSFLSHILVEMLGDWVGGFLVPLFAPIVLIDVIIARRTEFPVVRLSQSTGDDSIAIEEVAIYLRSKHRRSRGRTETHEMAERLAEFLRQNGYNGPMPDLEHF